MGDPSAWTDADLLERILSKNPHGWPEFLRRFGRLIRFNLGKHARDLSADDQDEVYHDVILQFLRDDMHNLRTFDANRAKLSTYIALHTKWAAGHFRRRAKRCPVLGATEDAVDDAAGRDASEPTFVDELIERNLLDRVEQFVSTLKPKDRQFFDLFYRQGLPPKQIATAMGLSAQAISLRKLRLLARIAEAFGDAGFAGPTEAAPVVLVATRDPDPEVVPDPEAAPDSAWQPRDYEARAVSALRDSLPRNRRVLAVGPTGCGKTVIASMLIATEPAWRVLFVVHRYELADQAYKALARNGIRAGIVMAQDEALRRRQGHESRVDPDARVQVASVQTLLRREGPERVDLIVFDEAHRVMADSYQPIANAHPDAMVLGLTATPERDDRRHLGDFFREMYVITQSSTLQQQQHLASPRWFGARADVVATLTERLCGAKIRDGDYTPRDLARTVDSRFLIGGVVSETVRIAPRVSKVVFAGSVLHSQRLAAKFIQHGIAAAHLDGETPVADREAMLEGLRAGRIEVICNYDVLSEGWDLPNLGAVILARPFRSRRKYLQAVGRGMRWRRGPRPIVIDHGNNAPRFDLWPGDDIEWSLTLDLPSNGPLWKQCEKCLERIPLGATVCPECSHACPIERVQKERDEVNAKLEEATRAEYRALRVRVEAMAKKKGAPPEWVDAVMESSPSR